MKAPAFWWRQEATLAARCLAPLGVIYGVATARRMERTGARVGVPVLCVGNLVAGGAGKTPAAVALATMLQAMGRRPFVLSRGYGRTVRDPTPVTVDPAHHTAAEVGDEPLLLARTAPTIVAADRLAAAHSAMLAGADTLILDDGLQNPALRKDWTLAVADGASGVGNGLCLPAGPLRAPESRQWPHVAMLCVIGPGAAGDRLTAQAEHAGVPVVRATVRPDAATIRRWQGRPLFAFAGIGRPAKFFDTLTTSGLELSGTRAFADHHRFSVGDLEALRRAAGSAMLVTTEKDRVRLPPGFAAEALPVALAFDEPGRVQAALPLSP